MEKRERKAGRLSCKEKRKTKSCGKTSFPEFSTAFFTACGKLFKLGKGLFLLKKTKRKTRKQTTFQQGPGLWKIRWKWFRGWFFPAR